MILVSTFWHVVLFFLSLLVLNLSPGYVTLTLCHLKLSKLEKLVLSLGLGIAISCSLYFFAGLLKVRFMADFLIIVYFLFFLKIISPNITLNSFKLFFKNNKLIPVLIPILIIIICSCFQSSLISGGGYDSQNGTIKLSQTGDAMWIISLSRELSKNIPPIHPGFAPEIVTNYHYFTHLFMGLVFRFTKISLIDLYYNYFSLFFCLFLGFASFILGKKVFKSTFLTGLFVLFTYTAGSFSYFLPFWLGSNFNWNESNFWVSQTFGSILNPAVMLSLSLFYLIIYCCYLYFQEKKFSVILPLIILSGTLISFKVYAGLIILGAFFLISFLNLLRKNFQTILIFLAMLGISLLTFFPVSGKDASSFLVYAPFWYLHTMVENSDRLNIPVWALKEQYYWATNNIFAVIRLRLLELLLFLVGNLGIRIVGFLIIPLLMMRKIIRSSFTVFILLGFLTGIIIPLFFIQNGSVGNTIQFLYYSLLTGNLLTIMVLHQFYSRQKRFIISISLLMIFLSLPTTVKSLLPKGNPLVITSSQTASLFALNKITGKEDIILLPPSPSNLNSMYVSVISERNTFYSHELMAENTLKNFQVRKEELSQFFNPTTKKNGILFQKKFLLKYNLNTLYILNGEQIYLNKIYIPYNIIFKNDAASIIRFL